MHQYRDLQFGANACLLVDPEEYQAVVEVEAHVEVELEPELQAAGAAVLSNMAVVDACSWAAAFVAGVVDTYLVEGAWVCWVVVPSMVVECV